MIRLLSILGLGGLLAYAYSRAAMPKFGGNAPPLTPAQAAGVYNQIQGRPPAGRPVEVAGLPNARRLPEGYVGMALPTTVEEVGAMQRAGIRCVVSFVALHPYVIQAMDQAGIRRWYVPFGSTFTNNHAHALNQAVATCGAGHMAVHCTHGVDRTGSALAYLLVRHNRWAPQDALWSQVNPEMSDVGPLGAFLTRNGLPVPTTEPGFYAPANVPEGPGALFTGGNLSGGMKMRTEAYVGQAQSTLNEMRRAA